MQQVLLVTVTGPDPKSVKLLATPDSTSLNGQTTLACSALLLHEFPGRIIAPILPFIPFLQPQFRTNPATAPPGPAAFLPGGVRIACTAAGEPQLQASLELIAEIEGVREALHSVLSAPSAAEWTLGATGSTHGSAATSGQITKKLSLESQLVLGSHVVVLKTDNTHLLEGEKKMETSASALMDFSALEPGTPVIASGCPFGALVSLKFHNFIATGAIAAVLHREIKHLESTVALADLKGSLPGLEGAAVMVAAGPLPLSTAHTYSNSPTDNPTCNTVQEKHRFGLVGMLGPPLRAHESHAELSLVLSATAIITAVHQRIGSSQLSSSSLLSSSPSSARNINAAAHINAQVQAALRAVVAVEAGGGWASGVLVSPQGHVLTAAHALPGANHGTSFQFDTPLKVAISPSLPFHNISQRPGAEDSGRKKGAMVRVHVKGQWRPAEVLYTFSTPLDLAVLKIHAHRGSLPDPISLGKSSRAIQPGSPVAVAGFPLWRPFSYSSSSSPLLGPLITRGNIALIAPKIQAMPAVVLTTAAVHAGVSGGAVLDPGSGQLIGVVTSNTRLTAPLAARNVHNTSLGKDSKQQSKVVFYPHLNYCIGLGVLAPVVLAVLSSPGAAGALREVEGELERAGAIEAWRSMQNMKVNDENIKREKKQGVPPAFAALLDKIDGQMRIHPPRPKL